SKRIVAPTPPARKKPAPSAPAATTGSLDRSLAATFVASPMPSRSCSTAVASWRRSASISRRTVSGVRPLALAVAAIGFQRLLSQLGLADGLLGHRRRGAPDLDTRDQAEDRGDPEQSDGD